MKDLLERMRGYVAKIRRAPEVTPTLTTLALQDNIEALEQMEKRIAAIEALHQRHAAEARDWAVGAKV